MNKFWHSTGVLVSIGLTFWWAVAAIVIGTLIGALLIALHATQGPRLGVPQSIQSRGQFGFYGAAFKPLRCRNVALTPGNRDMLAEEIASLDAALTAVPVLPPLLQHRLRDRRQAIADFLARNQPEPA